MYVSYPRLYRVRLARSDMRRIAEGGYRRLLHMAAGEWTQGCLYGVVAHIDGITERQPSIALDSACYYPTASGPAARPPEFADGGVGHEGDAAGFPLILHGWDGEPLCKLDRGLRFGRRRRLGFDARIR